MPLTLNDSSLSLRTFWRQRKLIFSDSDNTIRQHCRVYSISRRLKQDAQLSHRDRAAECVIVLAKSGRLELRDNILWTL